GPRWSCSGSRRSRSRRSRRAREGARPRRAGGGNAWVHRTTVATDEERRWGRHDEGRHRAAVTPCRPGGQGRGRTADLPIFSRTLVPTELPGRADPLTDQRATLTGLEPATSAVTGRRANQLRYRA